MDPYHKIRINGQLILRPDPVHIIRDHAGRVIAPSREIPFYEKLPSVYGPTARPL